MQLREMGWSPLASTVAHRGAELALGQPTPSSTLFEMTNASFNDDFVFLVNGVLYFTLEDERSDGQAERRPVLEAGAIHELGTQPPAELARLTSSLDATLARLTAEAAKPGVNGGMWQEVPWHPLSAAFAQLKEGTARQAAGAVSAGFPDFPDEVRQALRVLEDPERRKLALRIKAGEPLFVVREQEADSLAAASDALVDAGLVIRKVLVRCKKRSDVNLALLSSDDTGRLEGECPHCRARLRDEQFLKGLAPTALANSLLDHSHWMTSRVAQSLRNCGVMAEDVLTEYAGEGEEFDFVVSLYGSLAVMELKDRTFGVDDARDLFDRYLRFGAQELVAVTTDTVAPEARRRLEEAIRAVPRQPAPAVSFVEGLAELDAKIRQVVQRTNWRAVSRLLDKISSAAMPLDAKALVAAKFGIPISKDRRARWASPNGGPGEPYEYVDLLADISVKSYS